MVSEALESKFCTKCKKVKPVKDFYIRSDTGKLCSHCAECRSFRHKKRYNTDSKYKSRLRSHAEKWQKDNYERARFIKARANSLNSNRKKVIEFTLTFHEILDLWKLGCHYCGNDIMRNSGVGLDRINFNTGYIPGNVLPCCGNCNKIRNNILTVEETEVAIKAVLDYRKNKTQ